MNRCPVLIVVGMFAAALAGMVALVGCSQASSSSSAPPTPPTTSQAGLGQSSSSTPAAPTSTASPAPTPTVPLGDVTVCINPAVTCQGALKSEPKSIVVTGDGSEFVTNLVWTGWGRSTATGSGTMKIDNCNPNCAQGSFTDYMATIVVSGLTSYGSGQQAYADMTVNAPGSPYGTKSYQHLAP